MDESKLNVTEKKILKEAAQKLEKLTSKNPKEFLTENGVPLEFFKQTSATDRELESLKSKFEELNILEEQEKTLEEFSISKDDKISGETYNQQIITFPKELLDEIIE